MKKRKTKTTKTDCSRCEAVCCKNLAMDIGRPANKKEVDDLKWQLHFDTVRVFIRHRAWHLLVEGKCIYLSDDHLCTIYDKRSDVCRQHNPPDCELHGHFYDVMITTPDELDAYLYRKKKKKKSRR